MINNSPTDVDSKTRNLSKKEKNGIWYSQLEDSSNYSAKLHICSWKCTHKAAMVLVIPFRIPVPCGIIALDNVNNVLWMKIWKYDLEG